MILLYLDTNIIFDIARQRQKSSIFLMELIKGSEYLGLSSARLLEEVLIVLQKEYSSRLGIFAPSSVEINRIFGILFESGMRAAKDDMKILLKSKEVAKKLGLAARKERFDALHLSSAIIHKVDYFVTKDYVDILSKKQDIEKEFGLKVIKPSKLVPVIYETLEGMRGKIISEQPPCIEKSLELIKTNMSFGSRLLLANYFRRCFNYSDDEMQKIFERALNYDPEKTSNILREYPPCIIFCREVKNFGVCSYKSASEFCSEAMPTEKDLVKERKEDRISHVYPSPFYYYIRSSRKAFKKSHK